VSVATRISAEEFQALPDPEGNFFDIHELHDGEIVALPGPTGEHVIIQECLVEEMFRALIPAHYSVSREFYYTLPDQARRADVAVVLRSRREQQRNRVFSGAPDIVIEVLSASNGAAELGHLRRECLADQCQEFWITDPFHRVIEVYGRNGEFYQYGPGYTASLHLDGTEYTVSVDRIFSSGTN
jgi:Uma2 family endonuclease